MVWVLFVVVAVLVIAATLGLLAGRIPFDRLSEPTHTTPVLRLPEDASAEDVRALRFDTALRGYRMDQVDEALAILQERIERLERQAGVDSAAGWDRDREQSPGLTFGS